MHPTGGEVRAISVWKFGSGCLVLCKGVNSSICYETLCHITGKWSECYE